MFTFYSQLPLDLQRYTLEFLDPKDFNSFYKTSKESKNLIDNSKRLSLILKLPKMNLQEIIEMYDKNKEDDCIKNSLEKLTYKLKLLINKIKLEKTLVYTNDSEKINVWMRLKGNRFIFDIRSSTKDQMCYCKSETYREIKENNSILGFSFNSYDFKPFLSVNNKFYSTDPYDYFNKLI